MAVESNRNRGAALAAAASGTDGSVSFRGKWYKRQTDGYEKLYQAAGIRSRSAATRWTWMTRRQASETLWLMELVGRRKLRISSKARQKRSAEPNALKPRIDR